MLRNQVPLLAVNFIGDTTIQKNRYVIAEQNFIKQYNDTFATTKKLKVVIDTSYSFYSKHFVFRVLKNPTSEEMLKYRNDIYNLPYVRSEDSLRNVFVASYPILVYNDDVTEQKLSGESYEGLVMIQEAIDSDGR